VGSQLWAAWLRTTVHAACFRLTNGRAQREEERKKEGEWCVQAVVVVVVVVVEGTMCESEGKQGKGRGHTKHYHEPALAIIAAEHVERSISVNRSIYLGYQYHLFMAHTHSTCDVLSRGAGKVVPQGDSSNM